MPFSSDRLPGSGPRPGAREIVAMLAALMALNALAIDSMLPALPAIGEELGVTLANDRQLVIVIYMLGYGVGQLFWGPLADRFGRKPILAVGISMYMGFAGLCAITTSFTMLIVARALQGATAAVTRVLTAALARDLFEGEEMARIMSLVMMTFMLVPMLAPSLGQAILLVAPWQAIFGLLALHGLIMLLWTWRRLPETLRPEYRRSLAIGDIATAIRHAASERQSIGYTLAMTAAFGGLTAYIASIQQIIFDVFRQPDAIGLVFAAIAAPMAVASFGNSLVVGRYGLRRVGHSGAFAFFLVTAIHLGVASIAEEPLWLFVVLQGLTMASFAFSAANLGALAMEHMGPIAGTAASVQGVTATIGGAVIGLLVGQAFDGTQLPFLMGMAGCGLASVTLVMLTEPRRLFEHRLRPETADPLPQAISEL